MDDKRVIIYNHLKDKIKELKNHSKIPVTRIWRRAVDPLKVAEEYLPSIFYGYGNFFENNLKVGTNYKGETISLAVNAVVNQIVEKDNEDEIVDGQDLVTRTARLHTAIADIVNNLTPIVDPDTCKPISPRMNFRLSSGDTEFQGISDREFITFNIEIDWFYRDTKGLPIAEKTMK